MDAQLAESITSELSRIIQDVMPDAVAIRKYGGTVIELEPGQATSQCCGYFVYSKHVSLEFTRGADLADPNGVLEGSGRHRRHVKLRSIEEIEAKRCRDFLEQASKL